MNANNTPVVTICCTTYNQEKYISECIDSFLIQKVDFGIEILIHDDASTDNTTSIVREYECRYPDLIKVIYQTKNQYSKGIRITKEYLFPKAKGKYIAICEGDDYWTDPYKLQKQVDMMEQHPEYSMCAHAANILMCGKFDESKIDKHELTTEDIIKEDWGIMTASILFRKDMLEMPDWYGKIKNGDYGLQLLLSLKGNIGYLPDNMSVYRQHLGGVSATLKPLNQTTWIIYLLYEFNKYTNGKYKKLILDRIKRIYQKQIYYAKGYSLRKAAAVLILYQALVPFFPFLIKSLRK